jgi:hypothetical protein
VRSTRRTLRADKRQTAHVASARRINPKIVNILLQRLFGKPWANLHLLRFQIDTGDIAGTAPGVKPSCGKLVRKVGFEEDQVILMLPLRHLQLGLASYLLRKLTPPAADRSVEL